MRLIPALLFCALLAPACFAQTQAPSENTLAANPKAAQTQPSDDIVSHQRAEQIAKLKAAAHVKFADCQRRAASGKDAHIQKTQKEACELKYKETLAAIPKK